MMIASVKEKLHDYIEHADEKKLQAIFVLVENDIDDRSGLYGDAVLAKLRTTSEHYLSGSIRGYEMNESLGRMRAQLPKDGQ